MVIFTEEILNGKLRYLWSEKFRWLSCFNQKIFFQCSNRSMWVSYVDSCYLSLLVMFDAWHIYNAASIGRKVSVTLQINFFFILSGSMFLFPDTIGYQLNTSSHYMPHLRQTCQYALFHFILERVGFHFSKINRQYYMPEFF